jgi:hypothetical protein
MTLVWHYSRDLKFVLFLAFPFSVPDKAFFLCLADRRPLGLWQATALLRQNKRKIGVTAAI